MIEDDVVIYAGATILGRVTIGKGSVIGGSVWLVDDVPPHSVVTQRRATVVSSTPAPRPELLSAPPARMPGAPLVRGH